MACTFWKSELMRECGIIQLLLPTAVSLAKKLRWGAHDLLAPPSSNGSLARIPKYQLSEARNGER